jgi:methyl coenzyme M reductase beta subunit
MTEILPVMYTREPSASSIPCFCAAAYDATTKLFTLQVTAAGTAATLQITP